MPKPRKPTENGVMKAINGLIKEGLFLDFNINSSDDIFKQLYYNKED